MQKNSFFSANQAFITMVALVISFSVFGLVRNMEIRDLEKEFHNISSTYHSLLQGRMNDVKISLDTVSHSIEIEEFVKRDKFTNFADRTIKRMPELKAFFWAPVIDHMHRSTIEGENWNFGLGGKSLMDKSGNAMPNGGDKNIQHLPILYAEPIFGNRDLVGFDIFSDNDLGALFRQARDYNVVIPISGKLSRPLLGKITETSNQMISLVQPVYKNPNDVSTIAERRASIRGFVIAQIDVGLELEAAIAGHNPQGLDVYIIDAEADSGGEIIYVHKSRASNDKNILPFQQLWQQPLSRIEPMGISGRQWKIIMLPTSIFYDSHRSYSSWILLSAGIIFSLFLYNMLLNIHRRDADVKALVAIRTKELNDSETKVRSIINNVAEGIITIDALGTIETFNPAAEEMFGYKQEEVIGQNINILLPPAERVDHDSYINNSKLIAPRIINKARDLYGRRKNGRLFPMELNVSSMEIDGQRKFIGMMHDISERKKNDETLRKALQGLEQSADAVFITDLEGKIEYVNRKFVEFTGYKFKEVKGKNPKIIASGNTPKEVYADLWRTILSGNEWRGEIQDKTKGGEIIWASVTISPIRDNNGEITHFISSHRDITKRKENDLALRVAMQKTEVATKAKSELLANMSHELRTPLNAIIGFSDLIISATFGKLEHKEYSDYVNLINNSGRHLLDIINDILDVSAIEAGRVELSEGIVSMKDIVATVQSIISQRAEQGKVALVVEIDEGAQSFVADERRMKQILLNLVSNAVKFTNENGLVKINYFVDELGRPVISVKDNGIGMSESELKTALSQFGQVDAGLNRKNEGTGLGLPLTVGLINLHGGEITINSTKGEGTEVIIHFPAERLCQNSVVDNFDGATLDA
ncbi:MAG: PAS domain S-box protein [Rhodospirillaceae bacterium]|nr:PAS domain S-box protein [Rhodospirillaceae bacterium]